MTNMIRILGGCLAGLILAAVAQVEPADPAKQETPAQKRRSAKGPGGTLARSTLSATAR